MLIQGVLYLIATFALMIFSSIALEPPPIDLVQIRKIFNSPQSYNLHVVKLEGIVKSIETIPRAAMCGRSRMTQVR